MVKLYQIFICEESGWVAKNPEDFRYEIKDYIDELNKDLNIDEIIEKIKNLNINEEFETEDFKFKCIEMSEDQFNNLDEWAGW